MTGKVKKKNYWCSVFWSQQALHSGDERASPLCVFIGRLQGNCVCGESLDSDAAKD